MTALTQTLLLLLLLLCDHRLCMAASSRKRDKFRSVIMTVQGHSRLLFSVPVESCMRLPIVSNTNSRPISHRILAICRDLAYRSSKRPFGANL